MSMDFQSSFDFSGLDALMDQVIPEAVQEGTDIIRRNAVERAPEEDGDLRASAVTKEPTSDYSGVKCAFVFEVPWAAKEHEHLYYHHKGAGGPKYAELAVVTKGPDAMDHVGKRIGEALS